MIAIDSPDQMSLVFDEGGGSALVLVGQTVFSIGSDERYIVVKQHPRKDQYGEPDRSITNYFVVKRTSSPDYAERKEGVRGPLTKEEFEELATTLELPEFTKTFDDLE